MRHQKAQQQQEILLPYHHLDRPTLRDSAPTPKPPPENAAESKPSKSESRLSRLRSVFRRPSKKVQDGKPLEGREHHSTTVNHPSRAVSQHAVQCAQAVPLSPSTSQSSGRSPTLNPQQLRTVYGLRRKGVQAETQTAANQSIGPNLKPITVHQSHAGGNHNAQASLRSNEVSAIPQSRRSVARVDDQTQRQARSPASLPPHGRPHAVMPITLESISPLSAPAPLVEQTRTWHSAPPHRQRRLVPIYAHTMTDPHWHDAPQQPLSRGSTNAATFPSRPCHSIVSTKPPSTSSTSPSPRPPTGYDRSQSDVAPPNTHPHVSYSAPDAHSIGSSNCHGYPSFETALEGQSTRSSTYSSARTSRSRRESAGPSRPSLPSSGLSKVQDRLQRNEPADGNGRKCAQVTPLSYRRDMDSVGFREESMGRRLGIMSPSSREYDDHSREDGFDPLALPHLRKRNGSIGNDDYGRIGAGNGNRISVVAAGPNSDSLSLLRQEEGLAQMPERAAEEIPEVVQRDAGAAADAGQAVRYMSTPVEYITAPVRGGASLEGDIRERKDSAIQSVETRRVSEKSLGKHVVGCKCLHCYKARMRRRFECTRVWQRLTALKTQCHLLEDMLEGSGDPLSALVHECMTELEAVFRCAEDILLNGNHGSSSASSAPSATALRGIAGADEEERFASLMARIRRLEKEVQAVVDGVQLRGAETKI